MQAYRILVVEDDEKIATLVTRLGHEMGFDVRSTADFTDIHSIYDKFLPHIVVTDLLMPDMDGFEVLSFLHKRGSKAQIVILSGQEEYRPMAGRLGKGLELSIAGIVAKPFRIQELRQLFETIRQNLQSKDKQVEADVAREKMQDVRSYRLLVIEDSQNIADLVCRTATEQGFVSRSTDGSMAFSVFEDFRPHIIVLDIIMSDVDGIGVLRSLNANGRPLYVIIFSGSSEAYRNVAQAIASEKGFIIGGNLAKPFRIEEIRQVLGNIKNSLDGNFRIRNDIASAS